MNNYDALIDRLGVAEKVIYSDEFISTTLETQRFQFDKEFFQIESNPAILYVEKEQITDIISVDEDEFIIKTKYGTEITITIL